MTNTGAAVRQEGGPCQWEGFLMGFSQSVESAGQHAWDGRHKPQKDGSGDTTNRPIVPWAQPVGAKDHVRDEGMAPLAGLGVIIMPYSWNPPWRGLDEVALDYEPLDPIHIVHTVHCTALSQCSLQMVRSLLGDTTHYATGVQSIAPLLALYWHPPRHRDFGKANDKGSPS